MAEIYDWSAADINFIMRQKTKKMKLKIESLNLEDKVIGEIKGYCTGGTLDITNSDMIRRSLSLQFVANEKLEINNKSPFWINKRLRIHTGVENYNGDTYWVNQGVFVPTQPETSVSITGRTITLNAMDKMVLADNHLLDSTLISYCANYDYNNETCRKSCPRNESCSSWAPIYMSDAIVGLAKHYGETQFSIVDKGYELPYNMEFSAGDVVQDCIKEVTNLYMNYECFYNTAGKLVFQEMKSRLTDIPVWDFSGSSDFTISRGITADYTKIYNDFKVFGYYDDDKATQPTWRIVMQDTVEENPPKNTKYVSGHEFSVEKMGRQHSLVISEDNYTTDEQCKARAEYEKQCAENLINNFSISTAPIYSLNDVNRVIKVNDNGNRYTCLIDSITYPLDVVSPMTISCHEIFV